MPLIQSQITTPFFIGTTNSTGGSYTYEYTSGVTNSRTTTETLTFIVPSDSSFNSLLQLW